MRPPPRGHRTEVGAVVFDMDGVLVDSEPLWRAVERRVFATLGVELDDADCRSTMGLRVNEVVDHWYRRRPWHGVPPSEVETAVVDGVVAEVARRGRALPGVDHALGLCRRLGLRTAVASSSYLVVIEAVLDRLGLRDAFVAVVSAEHEARGKPDPAVYLAAAAALGTAPERCVAIEDSPNGIASAKAAGMRCLAVPEPGAATEPLVAADAVLPSLAALTAAHLLGPARG